MSSLTPRLMAALALVVVAAVVLAGCGGKKKVAPATTATTTSSTSTSAALPQKNAKIAAEVPSKISSKGTLTVAADATYAPNEFIASNGHTVVGMDPDLAQVLAAVLGLKFNVVNATFDTIIPGLSSGKYDLGMSSFTDTKEREKVV